MCNLPLRYYGFQWHYEIFFNFIFINYTLGFVINIYLNKSYYERFKQKIDTNQANTVTKIKKNIC